MPINCGNKEKARYRVKHTSKGNIRLAFCDNEVKEAVKLEKKAKDKGSLGKK